MLFYIYKLIISFKSYFILLTFPTLDYTPPPTSKTGARQQTYEMKYLEKLAFIIY